MGLAERLHSFMGYDEEEEFEEEIVQQAPEARVFSLRDDDNSAVLMKLSRMDEAGAAADHLAAGRMVVLNMEESTGNPPAGWWISSAAWLTRKTAGWSASPPTPIFWFPTGPIFRGRSRRRKAASSAGNRNIQNRSPVERWFRPGLFLACLSGDIQKRGTGPAFSIISFCAA